MASDDFSFLLNRVVSAYFRLGVDQGSLVA